MNNHNMIYFTKYLPLKEELKEGDEVVFIQGGKSHRKKIKYCMYKDGLDGMKAGNKPSLYVVEGTKLEFFSYDESLYPIRYFGGSHYADQVIKIELKPEELGLAKLFLCSRDIQVGNEFSHLIYGQRFHCTSREGIIVRDEYRQFSELDCYKPIGEISPEAVWVTEGMTFKEEDWQLVGHHKDGFINEVAGKDCLGLDWFVVDCCKIICTNCKTFH